MSKGKDECFAQAKRDNESFRERRVVTMQNCYTLYSVLVSVSCPKALYHLESDNLFRITVVVADWLG